MTIIEKAMRSAAARQAASKPGEDQAPAAAQPEATAKPAVPAATRAPAKGVPVSLQSLVGEGLLLDMAHEPALSSQLRHLKRAVMRGAFGELAGPRANIVMLTSAMPGAGKTFLSANLGTILAMERDSKVLVIDADNTRATLTRALGLREHTGFFDLLHDPSLPLDPHILSTDRASLSLLPSGKSYPDSLELLNSQRAHDLLQQLADADPGRIIVLDSPPLLATPDGAALASLAGQVLLIVEAGVTTEDQVEKALQLIDTDKPVGMVLNKIPSSKLLSLGGAYYYYTYSHDGPRSEGVRHA